MNEMYGKIYVSLLHCQANDLALKLSPHPSHQHLITHIIWVMVELLSEDGQHLPHVVVDVELLHQPPSAGDHERHGHLRSRVGPLEQPRHGWALRADGKKVGDQPGL